MGDNFARGRSAEVYQNGDGKVTKLFFPEYSKEYAEKEYRNTKVAAELGCTGMNVYDTVERDGRYGFVMDFVDGVSQNDMATKNPLYIFKGGKDLAHCHARVQKAQTRELDDIRQVCVDLLDDETMDFLSDKEKQRARDYIMSLPEDDTVLHLDFHTGNVLVDKDGSCKVIDWMTAARGNRAVEYAMMEFLFTEAEIFPEASAFEKKLFLSVRGIVGRAFFKEYNKLTPIDPAEVDRYRLLALIVRRSWDIDFERKYLFPTIRGLINKYGA